MALRVEQARIQSTSFKPRVQKVDTLVLHYTAINLAASLQVLRYRDVSAHYVLAEDGTAYKILENNEVAYHAGLSTWRGKPRVNERSIGIEIVNLDGNKTAYPPAQVAALIELCTRIVEENPGIHQSNIVGHSDIAPKRKVDPGKLFPWHTLASAGVGVWPSGATPSPVGSATEIQALLEQIGYPAPHAYGSKGESKQYVTDPQNPPPGVSNIVRVETPDILKAFQLRFQPNRVTGVADATTMGLLKALSALA